MVRLGGNLRKWRRQWREKRFFHRSSVEQVFTYIYRTNKWGDQESCSGKGSNLEATAQLRRVLPELLQRIDARTVLDIPCGDFHWMREVNLGVEQYIGADIVAELVEYNQRHYGGPGRRFVKLDLLKDPLPPCGVIFCRDCFVHLSFEAIALAIDNFRKSRATYLLATTFPGQEVNRDKLTGKFRPLNLVLEPFCWPDAMELIDECLEQERYRHKRKSLGLWRIAELPAPR